MYQRPPAALSVSDAILSVRAIRRRLIDMLGTGILGAIALSISISGRIAAMYAWLDIDREELAGFALILMYWCTLLFAHYYFETRVMRDRVRADICIARHRAAVLWEERAVVGRAGGSNGHATTNGSGAHRSDRAVTAGGRGGTAVLLEAATATGPVSIDRGEAVPGGGGDPVVRLLDEAERTIEQTCHGWERFARFAMTFLGWDSAPELSALQLLNAADILAWRQVVDETVISSRIVQAQSQLDELAPDQRRVWNRQFASFWCTSSELAVGAAVLGEQALAMWRSRLCAFLSDLYESRQVRNARLSSLQQKASWGVLITLWVLVALVAGGDGRVLLAGAIGGLLSRMTRFTGIRWLTTDFGLGWAQLYLAPPVGALAAWGGIHTLLLVQRTGTIDLHRVLSDAQAQGTGTHAASVLGLAIALGFSERLFDRLLRRAADTIVPPAEAPQPGAAH
jgi:hypothetical protein